LPWSTLLKVLGAVAVIWVWRQLSWLLMLLLIALIIAVGLEPVVRWLERRQWPRGLAAAMVVFAVVGALTVFVVLTWTSLSAESADLGRHLNDVQAEIFRRAPQPILKLLNQN